MEFAKDLVAAYTPAVEEAEELEGQGMVEYGLILVLVSVVAIAVLIVVGQDIAQVFEDVSGYLQGGTD